jgi:anti-sigma-K factor RskA
MSGHPHIPQEIAELISAYALGTLTADEEALAERHIAESDDCRRLFEDALETSAALALCVVDSEPSSRLRDRIVAAARAEGSPAPPPVRALRPDRRGWLAGLLSPSGGFAVAGVAAAIVFALIAVSQRDAADTARDRQAALVAILSSPQARVVSLQATGGGAASGRVVVAGRRAALVSSRAPAPDGRTYQAWGIPADGGAPVPLPTFSKPGAVLILDDVAAYKQVAVTEEPTGGSDAPSSTPFAAATL